MEDFTVFFSKLILEKLVSLDYHEYQKIIVKLKDLNINNANNKCDIISLEITTPSWYFYIPVIAQTRKIPIQ